MATPALPPKTMEKASFSTRSFTHKSWRETWTFRRCVPPAPAARMTTLPMPLIARVIRVRP